MSTAGGHDEIGESGLVQHLSVASLNADYGGGGAITVVAAVSLVKRGRKTRLAPATRAIAPGGGGEIVGSIEPISFPAPPITAAKLTGNHTISHFGANICTINARDRSGFQASVSDQVRKLYEAATEHRTM